MKVAAAHHPIIQKAVDELLSKGAFEPSSGGAGFYSNVFVVPKHTGGLQPTFNLKQFNHYLHIPSFKMPTIRHVWQLIQHGDYTFSLISRMLIYIFLLLSIIIFMIHLAQYAISVNGIPSRLATVPRVFTALTKPILFLCCHKGFCFVIYLHDILVLVHSKVAGTF